MNRRATLVSLLGLVLIGASAFTIRQLATHQRLGNPGVRIAEVPLLGEKDLWVRSNSVVLPSAIAGYEYRPSPVTDLELTYLPKDTVFGRGLYKAGDGFTAQASVVLMGTDRTSIHRPEYCLTGQGWNIVSKQMDKVSVPATGLEFPVQRFRGRIKTLIGSQTVELGGVYVFWFVAEGQRTASHWERQWWMIRDLVTRGVLQRWAYISFFVPCQPGREDEAYDRLLKLIGEVAPALEAPSGVAAR